MERGPETLLAGHGGQGLGLGDDEFSPINVPSLPLADRARRMPANSCCAGEQPRLQPVLTPYFKASLAIAG